MSYNYPYDQAPYGQQPPPQQGQPGQYGQQQQRARPMSYLANDDGMNPYGDTNGAQQQQQPQYEYGALPHRANSTAARQNQELFMDSTYGAPPPPPPRSNSLAATSPTVYGAGPSSPGIIRSPTFSNQHRPYNPAEFTPAAPAGAGYQHGYSPGYPMAGMQTAMPTMPTPGLYQPHQTYQNVASTYSQPHRPSVSTAPYSPSASQRNHYTQPQPPPLPSIPSGESPSADWGHIPAQHPDDATRYTSLRSRYAENDVLGAGYTSTSPPPPAYSGGNLSAESPMSHSLPPTPGPPPPPHGAYNSHNASDYLQSRPLPRVPSDASSPQSSFYQTEPTSRFERRPTDALSAQQELENELSGMLTSQSPRIEVTNSTLNGEYMSDDTDPEATAGLEAMREAERQEQQDAVRRQSGQRSSFGWQSGATQQEYQPQPTQPYPEDSDGDVPFADLSSVGGGFDAPHMSYGGDPSSLLLRHESTSSVGRSQPVSSSGSMRRSGTHSETETPYGYGSSIHPFPPFSAARVDAVGTGGLQDPTQFRNRRDSYDEGDDMSMQESTYLAPGEPPEMFYHPGITNRPLPQLPPNETRHSHSGSFSGGHAPYPTDARNSAYVDFPRQPPYAANNAYYQSPPAGPGRHTSLINHSNTPQTLAPIRAKTDAEERRRREQRSSGTFQNDGSAPASAGTSAVALDLPTLERKFHPSKLRSRDFERCYEPWALSAIVSWLKVVVEGDAYLKEQVLIDALVLLFTNKVPTMNFADAETLSGSIITGLQYSGVLRPEEEWLVFNKEQQVSGVVFQLTGVGCYAPKLHEHSSSLRCYSHHCQRTEKKIDLSSQPGLKPDEDWATYYKLKKEDIEGHDKKEIERQNILHEIVQKEENYLRELDVLRMLYRDQLKRANPPLLAPKKIDSFLTQVFGKVDLVKRANEDHLLPQMKYRQGEQGPWVVGFSSILREWIRKAKVAYIEYASSYPNAIYKIRQEMEKNMLFRTFLDKAQADPLSRRLGWDHYLKVPITRLQQLGLLLDTVMRRSMQDNDEKRNLAIAIDEIKAVTMECDSRVGEGQRKADLLDLQYKLQLRPGMQGRVELNLDHLGRELVHKGDLLRIGGTRFNWVETHAILFDHYLVLAKTTRERSGQDPSSLERYDVSRLPIPMDLLVLESRDDPPVVRSSLTGRAGVARLATDPRLTNRPQGSPTPGQIPHRDTTASLNSLTTVRSNISAAPTTQSLDGGKDSEKILYPFRIKHLGQELYTLYAPSEQAREDWANKIIEAKTKHATALFAQNAEPFRLRVIADSAFAYDGPVTGQKSIIIKGTPLDRAIREVEKLYANTGRPGPVCRARVNCATAFQQPYGKQMVAVGTDFGVYISEMDNPRGWQRVINSPKVTQIAVLEEFNLFMLISEKTLIAYHLDVICPVGGVSSNTKTDSSRSAPQKLSGSRDVGFFNTGRMKDRTLVFYKKRDGLSSVFKVLEPVFQKSSEKKSRFASALSKSGKTEFFRDFDDFYVAADCTGMNMFHSTLAISTAKGFEVMTLDRKHPVSIPNLEASHVAAIASKLANQKPLGMFRLSDQDFLCVYEECAVYVNKHGDISRSVIMEFVGKAKAAAMYDKFVLLFDNDFVEVRNAQNGRLRQVIWGRDVKCLDDAQGGVAAQSVGTGAVVAGVGTGLGRSVKLCMQHPEVERCQIVVELVVNEGLRE